MCFHHHGHCKSFLRLANCQSHLGEPLKNTNSQELSLEIMIQSVWDKASSSQVTLMIREVVQVGTAPLECYRKDLTFAYHSSRYTRHWFLFWNIFKLMRWTNSSVLYFIILVPCLRRTFSHLNRGSLGIVIRNTGNGNCLGMFRS